MAKRGADAFEAFYAQIYGERWQPLREALLHGGPAIAFEDGLLGPYYLDPASVIAAAALGVRPGERVLDLCAAPGGKSLVLAAELASGLASGRASGQASELAEATGELVCNERSSARRARLHRVLDLHLPPALRALVRVTPHDATRWALHEPSSYDRVLADVPCSSEQHVLQSAGALAEWSPSRTKRLAQGAYAIGCAAVDTVKPGGRVVYSTCALSPAENDGVVARLVERGGGTIVAADAGAAVAAAKSRHASLGTAERAAGGAGWRGSPTEYGWAFLPDEDGGIGPIYLAVLNRTSVLDRLA